MSRRSNNSSSINSSKDVGALSASHPMELNPEHRAFLVRSLDRCDTEFAALVKLNRSLSKLRQGILETCGESILLDLGEGLIALHPNNDELQGESTKLLQTTCEHSMCLDFLLRLKLRRKLLNRISRRLNRLAHAMDGQDVSPPVPPKYGDLRLHIDSKAVEEYAQHWKQQKVAKQRIEEQKNRDEAASKAGNDLSDKDMDAEDSIVAETFAKNAEASQSNPRNADAIDGTPDAPSSAAPDSTASITNAKPDTPITTSPEVPSLQNDSMVLREYNDAYEQTLDVVTGQTKYRILENPPGPPQGHGIGGRQMTLAEKELELKRWQTALLTKIPEQPLAQELGLKNRVFGLQERRKKLKLQHDANRQKTPKGKREDDSDDDDDEVSDNDDDKKEEDEMDEDNSEGEESDDDDDDDDSIEVETPKIKEEKVADEAVKNNKELKRSHDSKDGNDDSGMEDASKDKGKLSKDKSDADDENSEDETDSDKENSDDDEDDDDESTQDKKKSSEDDKSEDSNSDDSEKQEKQAKQDEAVIPKRIRPMSLLPIPSFYEQDLRRIRLIHADLMATSIHEHARRRIAECTNDYNRAFRMSNELYSQRLKLQSDVNSISHQQRMEFSKIKNDYALQVTLARARWQKHKEEWEHQKAKRAMQGMYGQMPVGTNRTQNASRHPNQIFSTVGLALGRIVDAVVMNVEGALDDGESFEPFVPPPQPSFDSIVVNQQTGETFSQRSQRVEQSARSQLQTLTARLQQSEEERTRAWRKLLKTKAEFEIPANRRRVDPGQINQIPVPPLRASSVVPPSATPYQQAPVAAYVPPARTNAAAASESESKYSAARVRERIGHDGTVAPVTMPKRDKDGLYMRPAGRTRKGMNWDAVRGIWVPMHGS